MPELGPYGSVRGAFSNGRPYRNSGAPVTHEDHVGFADDGLTILIDRHEVATK